MNETTKKLEDFSTEKLKCLVYDQLKQSRVLQQNIQFIEQEIIRREQNVGRGTTVNAADASTNSYSKDNVGTKLAKSASRISNK